MQDTSSLTSVRDAYRGLEAGSAIGAAEARLESILTAANFEEAAVAVVRPEELRRVPGTRHVARQGEDGGDERRRHAGAANLNSTAITIGVVDINARVGVSIG